MTVRSLHLAKDLSLPLDAVSRTFGILAVRGAGKSNTAAVMAEEMFDAGLPFVVIDPVGSWYGLRSSSDGKSPGLPIPIFGGKHGDMPLERGAGELIADLVVEKRLTCVLDLSRFDSEADKKAFLLAFAKRLYLKNENPLHLFLEEADDYIPQSPMGDEKLLLRAWENIVRRGRARGLGMTLITQRSAAVAKMVLTQVETLFAMRTTGPQDIEAIKAWVQYHQVGKEVLSSLAGLEDGEAWVWSPHYLKSMARHQIRRRRTFDSGATPANVRAKDTRPPATLADINIEALQERMAATIEKAKADDPKELRRIIAVQKKQLESLPTREDSSGRLNFTHTIPAITDVDRALLDSIGKRLDDMATRMTSGRQAIVVEAAGSLSTMIDTFRKDVVESSARSEKLFLEVLEGKGFQKILGKLAAVPAPTQITPTAHAVRPSPPARRVAPSTPATSDGPSRRVFQAAGAVSVGLSRAEQKVLDAVAWWKAAGIDVPSRHQVAFVAGYTVNGHFNNMVGGLRTKELVDYPSGGGVALTGEGAACANSVDAVPTRDELIARVLDVLKGDATKRIFSAVVNAGGLIPRDQLAAATGYTVNGHFNNMVGSLRSLGVIDYPHGGVVELGEMFEALA